MGHGDCGMGRGMGFSCGGLALQAAEKTQQGIAEGGNGRRKRNEESGSNNCVIETWAKAVEMIIVLKRKYR